MRKDLGDIWARKWSLLLLFWYKYLEAHFCLFWFWTSQNRITRHGFMYLENRDFGNKFGWYLGRYLEFFTKKVIWKYPFVKFIWSRITSLQKTCPILTFPNQTHHYTQLWCICIPNICPNLITIFLFFFFFSKINVSYIFP